MKLRGLTVPTEPPASRLFQNLLGSSNNAAGLKLFYVPIPNIKSTTSVICLAWLVG
jgi:hypothetical protein